MHLKFKRADEWSRKVIGAAIEVLRLKGPGLLGLLINFHEMKLVDGLHRLILPGADGSGFGESSRKARG